MPISQMNGQPLIYRTLRGIPARRVGHCGQHTSIGCALRAIFRFTRRPDTGGHGWVYWVEDSRGRMVAGPFDSAHRPSVAERAQP